MSGGTNTHTVFRWEDRRVVSIFSSKFLLSLPKHNLSEELSPANARATTANIVLTGRKHYSKEEQILTQDQHILKNVKLFLYKYLTCRKRYLLDQIQDKPAIAAKAQV